MSKNTTAKSAPWTNAAENPYLSGNFAPMIRESTALDLQTRGRVPDELEGRLLRIGPNPIGAVAAAHTSLCSPGVRFTKGVCTSS